MIYDGHDRVHAQGVSRMVAMALSKGPTLIADHNTYFTHKN